MDVVGKDRMDQYAFAITQAVVQADQKLAEWNAKRASYEALQNRLQTLPHRLTHEIMVPFGDMAFMPGQIIHTNEVMVLLGDNWFVERSVHQALQIIQRRVKKIDEIIDQVTKERLLYEEKRKMVDDWTEAVNVQDIKEDYDEEKEKQWRVQRRQKLASERKAERESILKMRTCEETADTESIPVPRENITQVIEDSTSNSVMPTNAEISPNSQTQSSTDTSTSSSVTTEVQKPSSVSQAEFDALMKHLDELEAQEEDSSDDDDDDDEETIHVDALPASAWNTDIATMTNAQAEALSSSDATKSKKRRVKFCDNNTPCTSATAQNANISPTNVKIAITEAMTTKSSAQAGDNDQKHDYYTSNSTTTIATNAAACQKIVNEETEFSAMPKSILRHREAVALETHNALPQPDEGQPKTKTVIPMMSENVFPGEIVEKEFATLPSPVRQNEDSGSASQKRPISKFRQQRMNN